MLPGFFCVVVFLCKKKQICESGAFESRTESHEVKYHFYMCISVIFVLAKDHTMTFDKPSSCSSSV